MLVSSADTSGTFPKLEAILLQNDVKISAKGSSVQQLCSALQFDGNQDVDWVATVV